MPPQTAPRGAPSHRAYRPAVPRATGVAVAAALAWALAGCSSAPRPAAAPPPDGAQEGAVRLGGPEAARLRAEIHADLVGRAGRVRGVRGRAEVRLSAPAWGGASWMEAAVVARAPGQLRLRAYAGPAALFDLAADAGGFALYVPESRMLWSGPPEALPAITGFPGEPADVVAALLGAPFGTPDSVELIAADAERATARWRGTRGEDVTARYRRRPLRAEEFRLARGDSVIAILACDDFLKESVGWWPRRWTLSWPAEAAVLDLQFRELTLNPQPRPEDFRLRPPADALRVEMGAAGPVGSEPR